MADTTLLGTVTNGTTHPPEAGSDRRFYVIAHWRHGSSRSSTGMDVDGETLTEVDQNEEAGGGGFQGVAVWIATEAQIANFSTGSITPTWGGGTPGNVDIWSFYVANADGETAAVDNDGDNSSPLTPNSALSTEDAGLAFAACTVENTEGSATVTWGGGFDETDGYDDNTWPGTSILSASLAFEPADGSNETPTATVSGTHESGAIVAVAISPLPQAPAAPSDLAKAAGSDDENMVLSWTDNATDEDNYHLQRSPQGAASWATIDDAIAADETSFNDDTVSPETPYDYRLRAENASGNSDWVELLDVSTAPAAPTGVTAEAGSEAGALLVSWTIASTDEDGFNVKWRVEGSGASFDVQPVGADETGYEIPGLTAGESYEVRVTAFTTEGGESGFQAGVTGSAASLVLVPSQVVTAPERDRVIGALKR